MLTIYTSQAPGETPRIVDHPRPLHIFLRRLAEVFRTKFIYYRLVEPPHHQRHRRLRDANNIVDSIVCVPVAEDSQWARDALQRMDPPIPKSILLPLKLGPDAERSKNTFEYFPWNTKAPHKIDLGVAFGGVVSAPKYCSMILFKFSWNFRGMFARLPGADPP
jgi:hypothetical protein